MGKHVLLAVAMCVFPATSSGGFLRDARTSRSQEVPAQDVSKAFQSAEKELAEATVGMRDAHAEFFKRRDLMKAFQARVEELTTKVSATDSQASFDTARDNAEDVRKELAKATAGVHEAQAAFEKQWGLMTEREARVKELSAQTSTTGTKQATSTADAQDKGKATLVNAGGSGKAAITSASAEQSTTKESVAAKSTPAASATKENVVVKSTSAVSAAEKMLEKAHDAIKSASANASGPTVVAVKPGAPKSGPGDTSAISRYIKGLTANSGKESIATSTSAPAAARQPTKWSIPYANAEPSSEVAIPSKPSGAASPSLSRMLRSSPSCHGCSENLALAYQKCAAEHGNPCKRLPNGRMKDGSCCLRKNDHNACLRCAQDGCPSADGCAAINEQYYSERVMMPQISIE